ncbi:leucine-rich repeat-containing protein 40-like isoform X2 [Saccostrea cucullata]|uniref:leucine-rich repeat-containing protein 40-like isoform X2 n=1 Tax=Saccostrea cuccullata TaxID=36930 RepID=UPI002ED00F89
MATRGRKPFANRQGFQRPAEEKGVHPTILKQARRSGQLNLSGRNLSTVPDTVWRLNIDVPEEAREVSLDNTEDRWWEQTELTKLILASNLLTEISPDISNFPALTVLDIHDNRLESLPQSLRELDNLVKLDVSRNKLKELPESVTYLRNLKSLHVEYNEVTSISERIGNLDKLEDLDLSNNQLSDLPPQIGYLTHVIKLNVSNNKLSSLPPELGSMNALKCLDATHNQLTHLPGDLGNLLHLEELYLRHNRLSGIPLLQNCKNFKELHLGNNQMSSITSEHLQHLASVSVLDIRDNKISELPEEITCLSGLQRLDLTNNDLTGLPFVLGTIQSLKSIVLDGNPMKSIRRDIIQRGTVELKKYLCSRIEEPEPVVATNKGIQNGGDTGIVGGSGEGLKAHDILQSKALDYSNKKVDSVPNDVWEVAMKSGVTSVNLSKNQFTDLPTNLILLESTLKEFYFGFNKLTALNPDIGLFLKLTTLDLRNNMLSDLPKDVESLQELREIVLSCNRLTTLPPPLYELKKLEIIFADNNKITTIDAAGIRGLPMLATLDLQNNNIELVPPELGNCTQIKSLLLSGNAFRNPRPAILAKGTLALLEYLRSRIVS